MSVTVAVVAAHVRQAIGKEGDGNHDKKLSLAAEYHRRGREHKFKKRTNSRRKEETETGDGVRPGKEARRAAKLARRAAWRAAEHARESPGRWSTIRSGSLLLFSMAAVSTIGVILVRCIPARRIYIRPPVWGGAAGRGAAGGRRHGRRVPAALHCSYNKGEVSSSHGRVEWTRSYLELPVSRYRQVGRRP